MLNEDQIINMLVLNQVSYQKFGDKKYYDAFEIYMRKLQNKKGFNSIQEACDYYLAQGDIQAEKLTA